jgi:hypothetical protein
MSSCSKRRNREEEKKKERRKKEKEKRKKTSYGSETLIFPVLPRRFPLDEEGGAEGEGVGADLSNALYLVLDPASLLP